MKKILVLLTFTFLYISSISAKKIELKKIYIDDTAESIMLDEKTDSITVFTSDASPKEIKDIQGLNEFKNLKSLDFYCLKYQGDWSFLYNLQTLRTLYIESSSHNLKSLKFLETLKNLEHLECYIIIDEEYREYFEKEVIDFSNLKNIREIFYDCKVWDKNRKDTYSLKGIPNFVNVRNKPKLYLYNEGSQTINKNDKNRLEQYSEINFGNVK